MKALLTILALLLVGCEDQAIELNTGSRELPAEVEEACDILGVECRAGNSRQSIRVNLVPMDAEMEGGIEGITHPSKGCRREISVKPIPKAIAHEIAHAHNLRHVENPADLSDIEGPLMCPNCYGEQLTYEEWEDLQNAANSWATNCPG